MRKLVVFVFACLVGVVAFPFILFYHLLLYLQYIAYQLYRSAKANSLLLRHGWGARQAYLRATAIDYATFSALRKDG